MSKTRLMHSRLAINAVTLFYFFLIPHSTMMAQQHSRYAQINQLRMYYEIHGAGYPLVLIHGGGSTIDVTFGRILPALAKTHRVIAVELQAHGRTADIDRPLSFEQDADDVAALLEQLQITHADIFGFSNGGTTALQIGIRHPGIVRRIIAASAIYKKEGAYSWLWESMKNASIEQMPGPLKDAFLQVNPDSKALLKMFNRDVKRMQTFQDIEESAIRSIKAPTLVLIGDADVVRPEHAVDTYRQIPKARLSILPGGHGDFIGEILGPKAGPDAHYPAVDIIETFLQAPDNSFNEK